MSTRNEQNDEEIQSRRRRHSESSHGRPRTFDNQFAEDKTAPSSQGSWRKRDDEPPSGSLSAPVPREHNNHNNHSRDRRSSNGENNRQNPTNNSNNSNNNRRNSRSNSEAKPAEKAQPKGLINDSKLADARPRSQSDTQRQRNQQAAGGKSQDYRNVDVSTTDAEKQKSPTKGQRKPDWTAFHKGQPHHGNQHNHQHSRRKSEDIKYSSTQRPFDKEYNKDSWGVIPCLKLLDPTTNTPEWYMLLQVSFSSAKLNFKADPFRGKREEPHTVPEAVSRLLSRESAGIFEISPEDIEKHSYSDDPSKVFFSPVQFNGGFDSLQSVLTAYDANMSKENDRRAPEGEGIILEQVKLIHKESNRRNNGRGKNLYNTLTKFPVSSQIQAAAVCFMFNLPEIEKNCTPLTLSVYNEAEGLTAKVIHTEEPPTTPTLPAAGAVSGSEFSRKFRAAREGKNTIESSRPHLETKSSHFPGDAATVSQIAPITNNMTAEEAQKLKEIVESITKMTFSTPSTTPPAASPTEL